MSTAQLNVLGTYTTGLFAESAAEILAFDAASNRLFVTNSADFTIDVIDLSNPANPTKINAIALSSFGGGVNSVSVNNGTIAVAIEASPKQDPGQVVFFDTEGNFISSVEVGALPDSLAFTPDGSKVVVANEGEPSDEYLVDPEGSISIIDLSGGVANLTQSNVTTVSFDGFDAQTLIDQGVRIFGPGASAAQDLEPEFVTVSPDSTTAWVTLQENNALAKIDLPTGQVEILTLPLKDYSQAGNGFDASNQDGEINIQPQPVFGLYQPDSIAAYEVNGQTYLVTANEGDARDYEGFSEEARVKDLVLDPIAFPNAAELQKEENLGRLKVTTTLGDTDGDGDYDELYAYGGRSFSIWDDRGNLIFDSGDALEQLTAEQVPGGFNSDDEENNSFDSRSDDKGPEPEALTIGEIDGRTFAFIGLERVGGIVVYDISNPGNPEFQQYINQRNFEVPVTLPDGSTNPAAGDLAPEGLVFIAAADSPTGRPLLAAANEVSGTTTLYDVGPAIRGSDRKDDIKGTDSADFILGEAGEDKLEGKKGSDTIFGGADKDDIKGGDGRDLLYGEGGNDKLEGEDGDDTLFGGDGDDELKGGKGDDFLDGGAGDDKLEGKEGNNTLFGGSGNDELKGDNGNDFLDGGAGDDKLESKEGNNTLIGGSGNDELKAGKGDDFLDGGAGDDKLEGKEGNDTLIGGSGNDELKAGKGNNILIGVDRNQTQAGLGEVDELIGDGSASDRFVLGDSSQIYYDDGLVNSAGLLDYALIDKFEGKKGDVIQLNGDASMYSLGQSPLGGETALFLNQPNGQNELIAIIDDAKDLSALTGSSFDYV